ncbi:MAG: DUF3810 domain-containing protein [Lachnospiraceae bacterium]|nr:DUF3810 domain-containing protein [Lachnospiraceae bacterium]
MNVSKKKFWKILIPAGLILLSVLLNMAARFSREFANCYVNYIFPIWVETYGRLTGLFPFSVGERMLYLAVILVFLLLLGGIGLLLGRLLISKKKAFLGRAQTWYKKYALFVYWVTGIVCLIMTCNCFMLYQVSPITERYPIGAGTKESYGVEEITALRNYVVEEANRLAPLMERDAEGYLVYNGNMAEEAKAQMLRLGQTIPNLQGYYPNPKPLWLSGFFSQQYIMGYYFPFSMEANYNRQMYVVNCPTTFCHELSHLKGFILEDEANFIGYLACVDSEDLFFKYSAYLSVIRYLDNDFYKAIGKDAEAYAQHPLISEQVVNDKIFLTEEAWAQVEEKAVLDTEVVQQASDTFTETTLTLNGVEDGKVSYSRVVDLLLRYYDGILY